MDKIFQEITLQSSAGIFLGSLLESFFSSEVLISKQNFWIKIAETVAQIFVGGFLSVSYFQFSSRFGIIGEDPTQGYAFGITMFSSQPHLMSKVRNIALMLRAVIGRTIMMPTKAIQQPVGMRTFRSNPANPDVVTDTGEIGETAMMNAEFMDDI